MNKTCTLEQAKRLKKLGVIQKANAWYADVKHNHPARDYNKKGFAAFDTDELLDMIPAHYNLHKCGLGYAIIGNYFETPSECIADFIISALDKDVIPLSEINNRIIQQ